MKALFVVLFPFAVGSVSGAWLYPQMDMELYRLGHMREEARRAGMYAAHPGTFPPVPGSATFRIRMPKGQKPEYSTQRLASEKYDEKSGFFHVTVLGGYLGVGALKSPVTGWEAKTFDGTWRAAAVYPDSELPTHLIGLGEDRKYKDLREAGGHYDTQKELLAYIECEAEDMPELRVGESVPEMLNEDVRTFEYDPAMRETADGHWRTVNALAVRYFRFTGPVRNVKVVPVWRDLHEKGVFRSGQPRFDTMRDVGVHTLRLCANDFLIDGLKRDRLPWGGDLTVSLLADAHVYGDAEIARRSLSILDAYTGDVNGIVTYSMWTVISHDLYQLYFGDGQFLKDRWWRIKWRVDNLVSRCDADGYVVKGLDWVFIDWAGPDSKTALNVIWAGALDAAVRLAERVDDPCAADYRALRDKVKANLNRSAWDEKRGLYRVNPADADSGFARQANIYAVLFNVADAARAARIGDELVKDELEPVGTPYVYGWELVALVRTGHHKEFFAGLEKVFGAMLDAGATSYWEGFNARQQDNKKYSFYGRPWGKSLCHAWSAWPAFLFVSEAMGVRPTSDGWETFEAKAIPGSQGFKAEIPVPCGVLKAEVTDALEVKTEVKPFCSRTSDRSASR